MTGSNAERRRRSALATIAVGLAALGSLAAPAHADVADPSVDTSDGRWVARRGLVPLVGRSPSPPATEGRWAWPLRPRPATVRAFVAPESTWGAGHRGLDLAGRPGQVVLAVEDGVVSHAGVVAGRGTVTVLHRDGLRSTYEPVDAEVRLGQDVRTGDPVGRLASSGSHCPARGGVGDGCLHLGARRGEAYLDPMPLLVRVRVILLPLH